MSWEQVALAGVAATPWRNGGGSTRELLTWPAAADWRGRISVADVEQDGPFSAFPGIERWFAVLEGEGVALELDGASHRLDRRSEPLRFDGGAATACSLLHGPTRDFNLMALPGAAQLRRVATGTLRCHPGRLVGLYAHCNPARLTLGAEVLVLPPATLAWRVLDTACEVAVVATDALWLEIDL